MPVVRDEGDTTRYGKLSITRIWVSSALRITSDEHRW